MTNQPYYGTKRIEAFPLDNTDGDPGYAVRYPDGYISWSPKDVFEAAYQPLDAMNFGHALAAMRDGHSVSRQNDGEIIEIDDAGDIYTREGNYWSAMQEDLLAENWGIVG